ncbi:MAG: hypothetical protein OZSIB_4326 [Candidatus Ozemobacter sibiricus]|uniref:Uncharacterized protein n=1 Tax=Candidatus Ozemobacter sibiricus TaxID=2268124 RepID=A0A367ZQC2_9BACT|nr:MAG: hypothetical protein OZSIB_4326 [Candidatus Ozemobacter sibiricus]
MQQCRMEKENPGDRPGSESEEDSEAWRREDDQQWWPTGQPEVMMTGRTIAPLAEDPCPLRGHRAGGEYHVEQPHFHF